MDPGGTNLALEGAADSGTASASSTFSGLHISATEAFNCNIRSPWGWVTASGTTGWLKWTATGTIDCVGFALTSRQAEGNRGPKNFTIEYSDDDSAWTTVYTGSNVTGWGSAETRSFTFASAGAHKYWRINVTAVDGGTFLGIGSLRFILADGSVVSNQTRVACALATDATGNEEEYQIFDGSTSSGWTSAAGTSKTIVFSLAQAKALASIKWTSRNSEGARSPKDYTIEGSNNFTAWTTLKTVTGNTGWGSLEERTL